MGIKKRKPKMELNFKSYIRSKTTQQKVKIIEFLIQKLEIKDFDSTQLVCGSERVKNYGISIETWRYKQDLWFRTYPKGMTVIDGVRFESPYIK